LNRRLLHARNVERWVGYDDALVHALAVIRIELIGGFRPFVPVAVVLPPQFAIVFPQPFVFSPIEDKPKTQAGIFWI